jgi:hypothetical protein
MSRSVIRREEFIDATLDLGGEPLDLSGYAATGLRIVAMGPSGTGKTNAGLLIAEQLAAQGWVSVLVDAESEIAGMYGDAVTDEHELRMRLEKRDEPIVVVAAADPSEFLPYGEVILEVADTLRKPIFLMVDEGQLFSSGRKRKSNVGESTDLINAAAERGRKRSLDLFVTCHRFAGSLNRTLFVNKNLTLIGKQEDPTAWSGLAPLFRGSKIDFNDLSALATGSFYCFSSRGVEKVRMPMAAALAAVAPAAKNVKPLHPTTFSQWDRAMSEIPTERLNALSPEVIDLLAAVVGLTTQQRLSGAQALRDEMEMRP